MQLIELISMLRSKLNQNLTLEGLDNTGHISSLTFGRTKSLKKKELSQLTNDFNINNSVKVGLEIKRAFTIPKSFYSTFEMQTYFLSK